MTAEATFGLQRFVPDVALAWDENAAGRTWQEIDATLCFVDISGFTNLSERLAQLGRIGAEELTETLQRVFTKMLDVAYGYGGSLLKFGGDALLLMFVGDDHAVRATSAAVMMRSTLRQEASRRTSVGRLNLRMSVGVHSGPVHLFCVGDRHRELVITGPAGTATTQLEHAANPGEILVGDRTAALLGNGATADHDVGHRLRWRKPRREPAPGGRRASRNGADVRRWIPDALRNYLETARPEAEHRIATVGFVRFCLVDELMANEGVDVTAMAVDKTVSAIQEAAADEGVTFLATDINEDGGKAILVAGAPTLLEDDEGRVLRAARRIIDADTPLHVHIGVNRGHVFAGEIGAPYRSTYTVMGDTVNVAARLGGSAPDQTVYASPAVLEGAHTLFETEQLEPLYVKGKTDALAVRAVHAELGDRPDPGEDHDLPFVGRAEARAALESAMRHEKDHAVVTVAGDAGIGKTRLMREALAATSPDNVISMRAEQYGASSPYRPLRDPLRELLGVERDTPEAMATRFTERIEALCPNLAPVASLIADVAHIDVEESEAVAQIELRFRQDRLADAVVALYDLLIEGPAVFVIDDAHWVDDASTHLLARITAAAVERSWSVIVARRDQPGGFTPDRGPTFDLEGLSTQEARELILLATAATPLRPHEIDAIIGRAEGNPLFLGESLRFVTDSGLADAALPDSLSALVGRSIDALSPLTRKVLRYASVLGRSFATSTLTAILSEENLSLDSATRQEASDFLEPDGSRRWRFRHMMARDVAYEGLSYRRRRQLHLRAASVIESAAGSTPEDAADLLAMHYSLGGDHQSTWRFARIAGDAALGRYANVAAASNFERAIEAARRIPQIEPHDLADVWRKLGDARVNVGLIDQSLDAYRRGTRLLKDAPIDAAAIHRLAARARERAGSFSAALREVSAGRRVIAGDPSTEAAQALLRLEATRAYIRQAQYRPGEAMRVAQAVLEDARKVGDAQAEAQALQVLHWAHLVLGLPGGTHFGEEALRIFAERGDLPREGDVTNNLGGEAYFSGRWDDALRYYEQARDAAQRTGDVVGAAISASNIGEVLANQCRDAEAEPVLADSARIQRASGFIEGASFSEVHLARVISRQGDHSGALDLLERAIDDFEQLGLDRSALEARVYLAAATLRRGDAESALRMVALLERDADDDPQVRAMLGQIRSEALAAIGRVGEAVLAGHTEAAAAQEAGLGYEWALLVLMTAALDPHDDELASEARDAQTLLEGLGVHHNDLVSFRSTA
jgi:class 3 adenylate cyclase/tetratricopeptide (TPR) repeat protein